MQRLRRIAEREMACHETCREVDLPLPVEGIEQGDAERLGFGGQIVEPITAVARDAGRRHVEITREVERHRAVQDAAHGLEVEVGGEPIERQPFRGEFMGTM